jgi:hypothetical protein
MKKRVIALTLCASFLFSTLGFAQSPDCAYPEGWASSMAFSYLRDDGVAGIDFTKTKIKEIASEKIGEDLYRQVHLVTFFKNTGEKVVVMTVNDASHDECSIGLVDVYVVSKKIGGAPPGTKPRP